MTVSSDRILENIYGITATGMIKNNIMGGNNRIHYVTPYQSNFRDRTTIINNNNNRLNITGGKSNKRTTKKKTTIKHKANATTKPLKDIIIYASPEYIKEPDLQTFMDKFFLYYQMSRSPNSSIYVIPPAAILKDMIAKRGDSAEGSIEMQSSVRNNKDIQWNKYLFRKFGNNTRTDKYRIDPAIVDINAYPNSPFDEIRRTNGLNEVYYISYKDKDSVYINSKPNQKTGNVLKFVARFNNGGYIFRGEIPNDVIEYFEDKNTVKKFAKHQRHKFNNLTFGELPFIGGNINTSFDVLQQYDDVYNNDHELAAEHFIRCFAKKDKNKEYFNNSDMIYNAVYYAAHNPNGVNMNDFNNEINDEEFKQLFKDFKPTNNNSVNQVRNLLKRINKLYNNVCDKNDVKTFINSVKNVYKNISDKYISTIDIMTGYIRNHDKINYNQVYNDIYDAMTSPDISNCQICSLINNAMSSNILPSLVGRNSLPVFCSLSGGSFESDIKQTQLKNDDNINIVENIFNKCPCDEENEDNKNIVGDIFNKCPCEEQTDKPEVNTINKQDDNTEDETHDDEINDSDTFDTDNDDLNTFFDD